MSIVKLDSKIKVKRSTITGVVPTIGPSGDHTDGTWSDSDIYSGEYFLNEADSRLWIGVDTGVVEIDLTSAAGAYLPLTGGTIDGTLNFTGGSPITNAEIVDPVTITNTAGDRTIAIDALTAFGADDGISLVNTKTAGNTISNVIASGAAITTATDGTDTTTITAQPDLVTTTVTDGTDTSSITAEPGSILLQAGTVPGTGVLNMFATKTINVGTSFLEANVNVTGSFVNINTERFTLGAGGDQEILSHWDNTTGSTLVPTQPYGDTVNSAVVLASSNATFNTDVSGTVIIGGDSITATADNTVYVPNLVVGAVTQFAEYTVATLPTVVAGGYIMVTDEVGGYTPAFCDGTNWRRVTDRAIVS